MTQTVPLENLGRYAAGKVQQVDGDVPLVQRLAEIGFKVGSSLQVLRPGTPCLLRVDNQRLSLRLERSLRILVDVPQTTA